MSLQLYPFSPLVPQHYTLAETQGEKDAENARKLALINAQNAGEIDRAAMQGANAAAMQENAQALERDKMSADAEQMGVRNALAQKELEANIGLRQQEQARLGVQSAREAERDRRILAQQAFENSRATAQDARAVVENQRADAEYAAQQHVKATNNAYADLGRAYLTQKPDANGEIDLTGYRSAVEQGVGAKLPDDLQIKAKLNPDTGGQDLYTVDKAGTYSPLLNQGQKFGVPVTLYPDAIDLFKSAAKAQMGVKPEQKDLEVIYNQQLGPDGMTLVKTPVSVFDKKSGATAPYNANANTEAKKLTPAQAAFMAPLLRAQASAPAAPESIPSAQVASGLAPKSVPKETQSATIKQEPPKLGVKRTPAELMDVLAPYLSNEDIGALNATPDAQKGQKLEEIAAMLKRIGRM